MSSADAFELEYEDSVLIAKGWGADRRVARQVRVLQATTADGVSLYARPDPGNAAELTLIGQALERLRALTGPGGLVVCDSACGNPKKLAQIAAADLRFVVALRATFSPTRSACAASGCHSSNAEACCFARVPAAALRRCHPRVLLRGA